MIRIKYCILIYANRIIVSFGIMNCMPSADFDKSSISKGAYTTRVTNGCSYVYVVVDISNGAYLFIAREVG